MLINGASGGLGTFAVQIAKGCTITLGPQPRGSECCSCGRTQQQPGRTRARGEDLLTQGARFLRREPSAQGDPGPDGGPAALRRAVTFVVRRKIAVIKGDSFGEARPVGGLPPRQLD